MSRVTIRVETGRGEVEVSEESIRLTWNGVELPRLEVLLEDAMTKVRRAYNLEDPTGPTDAVAGVTLSDTNRYLIYRAFDDGVGGGIHNIVPADEPGYFSCRDEDGIEWMEGTEVDGVLYSIVPESGGGLISVYVGEQLAGDGMSSVRTVNSVDAARTHIAEISAK